MNIILERLIALASPNRLAVIELLKDETEIIPTAMGHILSVPVTTLNHYLKQLTSCGLLYKNRRGRFVTYALNTKALEEVGRYILSLTGAEQWNSQSGTQSGL